MAIFYSSEDPSQLKIIDSFFDSKNSRSPKHFDNLSKKEKERLKNLYRFSGYRPNSYQLVSGKLGSV